MSDSMYLPFVSSTTAFNPLLNINNNAQGIGVQANQATNSPFSITVSKSNVLIIVTVDENFTVAGTDTISVDLDGKLVSAININAGVIGNAGVALAGMVLGIASGQHTLNVKMANAIANIIQNIVILGF